MWFLTKSVLRWVPLVLFVGGLILMDIAYDPYIQFSWLEVWEYPQFVIPALIIGGVSASVGFWLMWLFYE